MYIENIVEKEEKLLLISPHFHNILLPVVKFPY